MKQQNKLKSGQQQSEQLGTEQQSTQKQAAREFGSAEEMLRFDAAQTLVPPSIAERLKRSAGKSLPRSWWQRLFGD